MGGGGGRGVCDGLMAISHPSLSLTAHQVATAAADMMRDTDSQRPTTTTATTTNLLGPYLQHTTTHLVPPFPVPPPPRLQVRVDCGYCTAKEFLKSGLHEKQKHKQQQQQRQADSQPAGPPWAGDAAGAPHVPGYRCLREGLYVPVDSGEEAVISQTVSSSRGVPRSTVLLAALYDQKHPAGDLSGAMMEASIHLPDERSLPRRFVPWVGR